MLLNLFTGLFHKHCPLCKREVQVHCDQAVQRLSRWFCCREHADLYELELFDALHAVHCRHLGCHGQHSPLADVVAQNRARAQHAQVMCRAETQRRLPTPLKA